MRFGMTSGNGSRIVCRAARRANARPRTNNRLFLDALLWTARSGGRWRDLRERLGGHSKLNAAKTRSGSEALVHSA
jgi:transposase